MCLHLNENYQMGSILLKLWSFVRCVLWKSLSMCRGNEDLQEKEADTQQRLHSTWMIQVYLHRDVKKNCIVVWRRTSKWVWVEGMFRNDATIKIFQVMACWCFFFSDLCKRHQNNFSVIYFSSTQHVSVLALFTCDIQLISGCQLVFLQQSIQQQ